MKSKTTFHLLIEYNLLEIRIIRFTDVRRIHLMITVERKSFLIYYSIVPIFNHRQVENINKPLKR